MILSPSPRRKHGNAIGIFGGNRNKWGTVGPFKSNDYLKQSTETRNSWLNISLFKSHAALTVNVVCPCQRSKPHRLIGSHEPSELYLAPWHWENTQMHWNL